MNHGELGEFVEALRREAASASARAIELEGAGAGQGIAPAPVSIERIEIDMPASIVCHARGVRIGLRRPRAAHLLSRIVVVLAPRADALEKRA